MPKRKSTFAHRTIPFQLSILARRIGNDDATDEWLPVVEGAATYVDGATTVPFAGYLSGSTSPVTGVFEDVPPGMFNREQKRAGRPSTILRDVAVCLAYIYMEFGNPKLSKTKLREAVCDVWTGKSPDVKPEKRFHGILKPEHVKRSVKRALDFAPELAEPLRVLSKLHLIGPDPMAGALIHVIKGQDDKKEVLFEPALTGLVGEKLRRYDVDGILFRNVPGWVWQPGEEQARRVSITTCWRPEHGVIKVSPTFAADQGGQE